MFVNGIEIAGRDQATLIDFMKKAKISRADIVTKAVALGYPRERAKVKVAEQIADRLINREKNAGNIVVLSGGELHWTGAR